MNLTSTRMLQFFTVCVGVCAFSASAATTWVADNFEAEGAGYTNAYDGMAAGVYKMYEFPNVPGLYTNSVWEATPGDASTIVVGDTPFTAASRPLSGDAALQYLKLETEGQTLTRYVDLVETNSGTHQMGPASITFYPTPVYVDTLIKFTPSEDDPEITDGHIKMALFVNASSNLVVRHQYSDGQGLYVTNSAFTELAPINPEKWYRLTIKLSAEMDPENPAFEIWLDGSKLTHANGAIDPYNLSGGPWFFMLYSTVTLTQISFQGTGALDELVVTDNDPTFNLNTGLLLTLAFDDSVLDVTFDSTSMTNGQTVTVASGGSPLSIVATNWYQINSVSGEGVTYSGPTGSQTNSSSGTISVDQSGRTATIVATNYTGTIPTGLSGEYANVPADKLSAWAIASGLSEADVADHASDYLNNYLLNIDESINATIAIGSITYDSTHEEATITVVASDDAAVDFTKLNGSLVIWTSDDLASSWGTPTQTDLTFTPGATSVTVVVPTAKGKYIKAKVQ